MGEAALRTKVSKQEYLELERSSEQRHEYVDGEIFAMSSGTVEHSLIAANICGELRNALVERPCRVLTSDMRIKISATGRYTYPDLSVVCGRAIFEDETRDTLLNPTVIVEVLSDSSERYDRGDKFAQYRSIQSVKDYVLISQKEVLIEHFVRQSGTIWLYRVLDPGGRLLFESLGCEIEVDRVYLKVFEKPDEL